MKVRTIMSRDERLAHCQRRRKELEQQLKDAELIVALMKKYLDEADRLIDDIRVISSSIVT